MQGNTEGVLYHEATASKMPILDTIFLARENTEGNIAGGVCRQHLCTFD